MKSHFVRLMIGRRLLPLAALGLAAGLSGCATTSMKGTPFYTGEYAKRTGPAEERVNVWPLLYYRDPALSVLWPIFELTDEHLAVRPLFSIYDLDKPKKEINVLWPIAQFDQAHGDNRIFPVFWGRDYACVFPLYWHIRDPFERAATGVNALFPLWIYFNGYKDDYSLHLLWPLFNRKEESHVTGWRLWPFYADWRYSSGRYEGWYAWPLGWRDGDKDSYSHTLFPLFTRDVSPSNTTFATLLFGRHEEPDRGWSYLLPLGFRNRSPDGDGWFSLLGGGYREPDGDRFWYVTPGLAWGRSTAERTDWWAGGPLFHYASGGGSSTSHLLPFYFHAASETESLFVSLPYSRHRDPEGGWDLAFPFWFHYEDAAAEFSITPLFLWGRNRRTGVPWSAVPPLYYHRDDAAGDTFLTPLYGTWPGEEGRRVLVPPALTFYRGGENRRDLWTLGGLGHVSWGPARGSSHLFPLYYENADRSLVLSPLWAAWESDDGARRLSVVPPLLSWMDRKAGVTSLHLLASLAKFNLGEKEGSSWVVPLYYRDPSRNLFLSLPYAHERDGARETYAAPLLLSWLTYTPDERRLRLLLGLYGWDRPTDPKSASTSWLVPVYASGKNYFLTLLAGRVWDIDGTLTYFPTPLIGWFSGDAPGDARGHWIFPLYAYGSTPAAKSKELFYFPWGYWSSDDVSTESGLFPIYEYENIFAPPEGTPQRTVSWGRRWSLLLLAGYENRHIPQTHWDPQTRTVVTTGETARLAHRLFPLWWYDRTLDEESRRFEAEFSLLFFLQDYWRRTELKDTPETDYTRFRILWRLVHYERDHDAVSLDLFPAITYDRSGSDLRKVSFLWRGFRYERKKDEKAVDLLFIPVWRTSWVR